MKNYLLNSKLHSAPHTEAAVLNSGRNCLRFIIRALKIKKICCPYYTCSAVWQNIKEEGCKIEFYNIGRDFMPEKEFEKNSFILYTNYFGICAGNVKKLSAAYPNLIADNAQAFFMPLDTGAAAFNSARKFFPVSDGAFFKISGLKQPEIREAQFERHSSRQNTFYNFKCTEKAYKTHYSEFLENEAAIDNSKNTACISKLSETILSNIDYKTAAEKRLKNVEIYAAALSETNGIKISLDKDDVPMVYPYWTEDKELRYRLIKEHIYLEKYWNGKNADNILPLPLDERYTSTDINYIINRIKENS